MNSNIKSHILIALFTAVITGAVNYMVSTITLPLKIKEEIHKLELERRGRGATFHCENLKAGASLASEIEFKAGRGYMNNIYLADLLTGATIESLRKVPDEKIKEEQLMLEKKAAELVPFLTENQADILHRVTLHHSVLTAIRTSKFEPARNSDGSLSFDANDQMKKIRDGARQIAAIYRTECS